MPSRLNNPASWRAIPFLFLALFTWPRLVGQQAQAASPAPAVKPAPGATASPNAAERSAWLRDNRGAAAFPARLIAWARAEPGAEVSLALLAENIPFLRAGPDRKKACALAGECAELAGRWKDASAWYREAARAVTGEFDPGLSLRAAYAFMASGALEEARTELALAGSPPAALPAGLEAGTVLMTTTRIGIARGWLDLASGRTEGLEAEIRGLLKDSGDAEPSALFLLCVMGRRSLPDALASSDAARRLLSIFPASPEAAILRDWLSEKPGTGTAVRLSADPFIYLSGILSAQPIAAPSPSAGPPAARAASPIPSLSAPQSSKRDVIVAYQVGTFSQRINAEGLASELRGKGLIAELRERKIGDGIFYAVLVPAGKDPGETDLRLKQAGYETFPQFD